MDFLKEVAHMCSCLQEIKAVGAELAITPVIIRGEELKDKGFGGTAYGFSIPFRVSSLFQQQCY